MQRPVGEFRDLKEQIDLNHFMKFELIQGANDSAPIEEFNYVVELTEFTSRSMILKLEFEYPLSISTGSRPDIFRWTILNPNFFISKDSGKTIESGEVFETKIPRQFPNPDQRHFIERTGATIEAAAQTAGIT